MLMVTKVIIDILNLLLDAVDLPENSAIGPAFKKSKNQSLIFAFFKRISLPLHRIFRVWNAF